MASETDGFQTRLFDGRRGRRFCWEARLGPPRLQWHVLAERRTVMGVDHRIGKSGLQGLALASVTRLARSTWQRRDCCVQVEGHEYVVPT